MYIYIYLIYTDTYIHLLMINSGTPYFLLVKTQVSCRFSLKPIH